MKSLQKEQNSTNLLLWPPICRNKPAISPKWFDSLDTNSNIIPKITYQNIVQRDMNKFFVHLPFGVVYKTDIFFGWSKNNWKIDLEIYSPLKITMAQPITIFLCTVVFSNQTKNWEFQPDWIGLWAWTIGKKLIFCSSQTLN